MRVLVLVIAALLPIGCRTPSTTSPVEAVVAPVPSTTMPPSPDGGADAPLGRRGGCRSSAELSALVGPIASALARVAPATWESTPDKRGRLVFEPDRGLLLRDPHQVEELLDAIVPFAGEGAIVRPTELSGHRVDDFHCRTLLVRGTPVKTGHVLCVHVRSGEVVEVMVDLTRKLSAFDPLLRISDVEARRIAIRHAETKLRRGVVTYESTTLLAECDASLAAANLLYRIDLVSDGELDIVEVDAAAGTVRSARSLKP